MNWKWKWNPTLLGFMRKEFIQSLRDPRMRGFLFVAPVMQMTLFGVALTSDVTNVRLSYQASRPGDRVLEHVYQHAIASGWFVPAKVSKADPYEQIQADEADAVLVAPPEGLTATAGRGQGQVQVLINASNVLKAQSVESYLRNIVDQVDREDFGKMARTPPVRFDMRILFNPTMKSSVFMVPGVMSLLICLITVLMTSMSISKEKETGTFEMLISAPVKVWEVMLGKTLPYVVLGMSNVPLILGVAVFAFKVPMRGNLIVLVFSSLIFICTTVAIGTLISTLTRTQQQSMMGGFLFLFPAIQLSGLMFPLENMPAAMKVLAYLDPLTHFLLIIRNIMLKGGDPQVILFHLSVLIVMAAMIIGVSYKKFKTTLG